jgi:molecular chaperone DnaK (HSP70)
MRIAHELRTPLEGRLRNPNGVSTPSRGLSRARPRFSLGIDLGTAKCALAFVALDGDAESEVLTIPQLDSPAGMAEAPTLPSFLYLPEEGTAEAQWVAGSLARTKAAECPGRVAHSAKSWLCHHAADRSLPFLPWGSSDIADDRKISPVRASALLLGSLRDAWNHRFAGAGADFAFDSQVITVTVPASFDPIARRLTLAAAEQAGFPETVRLLEEPQAAFYRWLEQHGSADSLAAGRSPHGVGSGPVLVIDIGGGSTDFSLFEFRPNAGNHGPLIELTAASNHILLGGDNIDLAIAHLLEPQLVDAGTGLSGGQRCSLVDRCRDVKEKALSGEGRPDEVFTVSIPGRGPDVIDGLRSAHLVRADIEALLLDAFFPECDAEDGPMTAKAALGEWGLPYAPDPAVTRHLADFLRDRPPVGALLFHGGSLQPRLLRQRISQEIGKWQACPAPIELENSEPGLAVACGAAYIGKINHFGAERVEARTAHVTSGTGAGREQGMHERVRELAYRLWEVEGRPEGRQLDHWTQAELEVAAT